MIVRLGVYARGRPPLLSDADAKRVCFWVACGVRSVAVLKERVEKVLHYEKVSEATIRRLVKSARVPRPAEHLVFKNQRRAASKKRLFELLRSTRSTTDLCGYCCGVIAVGSQNYSGRGLDKNIGNVEVHFREKDELHTSFQKEFNELFDWDIFSPDDE